MPHAPTWTEVSDKTCVLVPVGSYEQHGPHLPLDTDTQIAAYLCERISLATNNIVVAPPIGISASGEHSGFPGTMSIGNEVLATVVIELVRSCDWATGVVLVNGHGGNFSAVQQATTRLHAEQRRVASWWPQIKNGDAHAGMTETSMMLAINPDAVRMPLADLGNTKHISELSHELMTDGVRAVSPNGILGDARNATAHHGQLVLDESFADLAQFIDASCSRWHES